MEGNSHGGDDVERSTGLGIRWMTATWRTTWAERGRADSAVTVGRRGASSEFDMGCMAN